MMDTRRYDLDWLRVIAFGILIYFHSAIIFIPGGLPLIQNQETSAVLNVFVQISSQFRLGLLFLISGVGVAFARKRKSNAEFVTERSRRLLIPLAVGLLIVVPPMVYLEKVFLGQVSEHFLSFYPSFFTRGVYPQGNLSWHHFWFVVYLYLFCLIGLRLFPLLDGSNSSVNNVVYQFSQGARIYAFVAVLIVVELPLRVLFPGFRDLIHDWASFSHWLLLFLAGFTIANHLDVLNNVVKLRLTSLIGALVTTGLVYYFFTSTDFVIDRSDPWVVAKYIGYCILKMAMAWFSLLTCLGYAGKYLRFSSPLLSYLNEGVYPLFILHLTIITALGFYTVALPWGVWPKFIFITSATLVLIVICYHYLIRPFDVMRLLFGVKPRI